MNSAIFTTERLEAHLLTKNNEKLLIDLYSRDENTRYLEGLNAIQDIALTFDSYRENNNIGAYLIFCKKTKDFIGFGGVQNQEPLKDGSFAFDEKIEFVIMIDSAHLGKGYAKEFSAAFLNFFFENLPDLVIPARVNQGNFACIKLLEKLGFIKAGEVPYYSYENKFHLLKIDNGAIKARN